MYVEPLLSLHSIGSPPKSEVKVAAGAKSDEASLVKVESHHHQLEMASSGKLLRSCVNYSVQVILTAEPRRAIVKQENGPDLKEPTMSTQHVNLAGWSHYVYNVSFFIVK